MMQEMNISTLKLADGSSVEVKPVYGASITVANKEAAYTWLRENGLGDLIKNEITVSFRRNDDNKAQQYAVLAKGQGFEPVQKLTRYVVSVLLILFLFLQDRLLIVLV